MRDSPEGVKVGLDVIVVHLEQWIKATLPEYEEVDGADEYYMNLRFGYFHPTVWQMRNWIECLNNAVKLLPVQKTGDEAEAENK